MKRKHSSRIVIQALPALGSKDYWDADKSKEGSKLRKLNSKAAFSRGCHKKIIDDFVPWQAKRVRNKQNRNRKMNALCFGVRNIDHVLGAQLRIMSQENDSHLWSSENIKSSMQVRSPIAELSAWKVKKRRSIVTSKCNVLENSVISCEQANAPCMPGKNHLDKGTSSEMGVDTCYEGDLVMSSGEIGECLPKEICDGAEETGMENPSKSSGTDHDTENRSDRCSDISKDHIFVTLDSKFVSKVENQVETVSGVGYTLTTENGNFIKVNDAAIKTRGLQRYPRLDVLITYSRKRRKNSSASASSLPSTDAASSFQNMENKKIIASSDHYQVSLSYCSRSLPEEVITGGGTFLMGVQQVLLEKAAGDSSCSEIWNKKEIIQVDNQKENINGSMVSVKDESPIDSMAEKNEQKRNETDAIVNDIEFAKESPRDACSCDLRACNDSHSLVTTNEPLTGEGQSATEDGSPQSRASALVDGITLSTNVGIFPKERQSATEDSLLSREGAFVDGDTQITNVVIFPNERLSAAEGNPQSRASAFVDGNNQTTNLGIIPMERHSATEDSPLQSRASASLDGDTPIANVGIIPIERQSATEDSPSQSGASSFVDGITQRKNVGIIPKEIQSGTEDSPSQSRASAFVDGDPQITNAGIIPPLGRMLNARSSKKLLVLDVNGLLADIVPLHYVPYSLKADIIVSGKAVFKRPFHDDFLQFCFERFNVGVWSSRIKRNMELVLDFLLGNAKHKLLFCWDQSHCTDTGFPVVAKRRDKPIILKKLKKLWEKYEPDLPWEKGEYDESNTLLLDDSPHKALCNPPYTAVFPNSYHYKNENDDSLGPGGDLRVYLEGLSKAENVQKYVESNPFGQRPITERNASWRYYRKVIDAATYLQDSGAKKFSTCNCRY